ncbi:flagellar hook-associated protein FlgK [Shewanella sp. GXUN23E]|uniref:flagellar hook-associated protein FlgK n=1 Tax=Shewanella sp. GXUN23E TaxID=3422498 RepID=UPI003D7E67A8
MKMINTALSGLNASMAALQTMANNTTNGMTPGYSRQQVVFSSVGGGAYGAGTGVMIEGVRRISDQYQVAQLWRTSSDVGFAQVQDSYFGNIEQIFGAEGNNISKGLDQLFAAMNSALEQPNEIAYRQAVLNEANGMAQRFNSIAEGINAQQQQIEGQLGASVSEVNTLLKNIAGFNKEISAAQASGTPPASLLDARDAAIDELAGLLDIRVVTDSQGLVNISLAQGQPLLSGTTHASLQNSTDAANPDKSVLAIRFGDASFPLNESAGGSLGSLIEYRDNSLSQSKAFIDELASTLADEMNAVLAQGTDLNGNPVTEPLFIYEAGNPSGSLRINKNLKPEMLGFGKDGSPGDNSNLKDLIALADKEFSFDSLGTKASMGDAFAAKVGQLGSSARQADMDKDTAMALQKEARTQWAATSGVNLDEEGANLIIYQQAYQANARVIATADQLFQSLLSSFN